MTDTWRPIKDFPGYEVNQHGDVQRTEKKKLKGFVRKGHGKGRVYGLYFDNEKWHVNSITLVKEHFPELFEKDN